MAVVVRTVYPLSQLLVEVAASARDGPERHRVAHAERLETNVKAAAMTTEEHQMWDDLNIEYENAYRDNPFKKACVETAISLLTPGSRVLDVGCGTGIPVAQMLSEAGMLVTGIDVSPNMTKIAQSQIPTGTFEVGNMVEYEPRGQFAAIFIIYSHLGLSYAAFHRATSRLAQTLLPDGLLVIGQSPADDVAPDDPAWDETKAYVEGYNLPFWGEPFPTLMLKRESQKEFLRSMGMDIVYDTLDVFQPNNPKCAPEHQQYVIARRRGSSRLRKPEPKPYS
ncbi:uncharacterized protein LTR77_010743 [Saxophila tyrrhenica]|uniref:Methyltransferase domain-containing protein n=1 Tax=Saxophila tyrrhenica TaxID=1690608 RepID=A0AAV9NUU5_9PEZI|nr:hypothetical protein LTR77_010743 [Saxophila tyrrhenica]